MRFGVKLFYVAQYLKKIGKSIIIKNKYREDGDSVETRYKSLIVQGEGISTEFKECKDALPKSIFETLCSFLNRFGGDIFLGVADDGTIIGIDKEKSKK